MMLRNSLIIVAFLTAGMVSAQNLIPSAEWQVGTATDNLSAYINSGPAANNINDRGSIFVSGTDPFGGNATIWHVNSDPNEQNYTRYYGFKTTPVSNPTIDTTKDYRYTVWVKMLGANATTQNGIFSTGVKGTLNGSTNVQVQWRSGGNVPSSATPINNQWFLVVAYINGNGSTKTFSDAGMYDMNANKVGDVVGGTPMLNTGTPSIELFTHLRFNPGTNQSLVFFDPRLDEVNTSMPSKEKLIDPSLVEGGASLWATNTNGVHYNAGNVGIGTEDPGTDWKLAVNGKIRSKEIKVETGWADYVFEKDYPLPTLQEVEKHIAEKGHLINIPSAEEVETNGIELGEMNKLLLEKIEELTLYVLELNEKVEIRDSKLEKLQSELDNLKKRNVNTKQR